MASAYTGWNIHAGDGSDEDEDLVDEFRHTKESIYWCIEATPTMLAPMLVPPPPTGDSSSLKPGATPTPTLSTQRPPPTQTQTQAQTKEIVWKGAPAKSKLEECLRCVYAMMKRKVISSPKDLLGVLIWNTEETVKSTSDHCHLLVELKQIDAQMIKDMRTLLQRAEEDPEYLQKLFKPWTEDTVIGSVFANANTAFREESPNANNRIFWVTDNDDPVKGNTQLTDVLRLKRTDATQSGYKVETFFVPPTFDSDFDLDKFYAEVMTEEADDEAEEAMSAPIVSHDLRAALDGMVTSLRTKETAKRVAFKVPFVLGKELSIGITGYNMIGEETRKLPVKVDLNTSAGDEIIRKTVYKDTDTGTEIDPKRDIKKFYQVGKDDIATGTTSAKIFFSEADVRKVKTLGRPPSLKLLGFKPRKGYLRFEETVKHSYFIYPDEERYTGSTRTFAALHKSMLKKEVVGFASFLARSNSRPQVVLLLPQEEKLHPNGVVAVPGGIHLCQLPFVDDVRDHNLTSSVSIVHPPDPETGEESEQPEIDTAKKIIKHYSKTYNPESYPNPALNYFYDTLAAVALDEDIPQPEDNTRPAYETIEKRIGHLIRDLRKQIPQDQIDPTRVQTSTKKRVVKAEQAPIDLDAVNEFVAEFQARGVKLKVDELKAGLRVMGLPTTGKKADLVDRIQDYVDTHDLGGSGAKKSRGKASKVDVMDLDDDDEEDEGFLKKPKHKKAKHVLTIDDDDDE
ncbi:Ku DNA-binding complex, Ku70 subunit [Rhodotorula sp. JG-1b]|nr:Ku DNA-binding complex, Ku70 subunit [Rhodotorula sp. JG-1b]